MFKVFNELNTLLNTILLVLLLKDNNSAICRV